MPNNCLILILCFLYDFPIIVEYINIFTFSKKISKKFNNDNIFYLFCVINNWSNKIQKVLWKKSNLSTTLTLIFNL